MGRDDGNARLLLPGDEFLRSCMGDLNGKDRAHGGPHRFQRERIGRFADKNDAGGAGRVSRPDDRSKIARIAHAVERHPRLSILRPDIPELCPARFENADHHLRIVATRDRGDHLLADFEHQAAGRYGLCSHLLDQRLALGCLGVDERADCPAELDRVDDELQPFSHEGAALFTRLLVRQRLDVFNDRIGKRGDFLHLPNPAGAAIVEFVHFGTQREKREVESARPGVLPSRPASRMTSSPDSTTPPAPRIVSRINSWIE